MRIFMMIIAAFLIATSMLQSVEARLFGRGVYLGHPLGGRTPPTRPPAAGGSPYQFYTPGMHAGWPMQPPCGWHQC
jgi:hypothetical protein